MAPNSQFTLFHCLNDLCSLAHITLDGKATSNLSTGYGFLPRGRDRRLLGPAGARWELQRRHRGRLAAKPWEKRNQQNKTLKQMWQIRGGTLLVCLIYPGTALAVFGVVALTGISGS